MDFSRPDNARQINKLKVLNALRRGKLSRADLSREILLSKVSISEIVEALLKEGLIEEAEKDMTTTGRPSTKLQIKKNSGRVFAIEIKHSVVTVSISDMIGRPLRFERFPKTESLWDDIIKMIEKLSSGCPIYGICFVLSENIEIPPLPYPYIITSPAIAQAKAEINLATASLEDFYFVSWSEDLEAAFFHSSLQDIKTFAHMKVVKNAPCRCGGNGCLEAIAAGYKLKEKTGKRNLRDLVATPELEESAKSLVFALSEAIQATSAKAVMLTGELSQLSDELYATMQNRLTLSLPPERENVFIYRSQCGERGSREGAGILALEKFFYHTELISTLKKLELN